MGSSLILSEGVNSLETASGITTLCFGIVSGKDSDVIACHYFLVPGRQHLAHDRKKTSDSSMEKSPGPIFPIQETEILAWLPDITAPEKYL